MYQWQCINGSCQVGDFHIPVYDLLYLVSQSTTQALLIPPALTKAHLYKYIAHSINSINSFFTAFPATDQLRRN